MSLLDPNVVMAPDAAAIAAGAVGSATGATAVAGLFVGRAQAAKLALIDGLPGLAFAPGGRIRAVLDFVTDGERVLAIEAIAEPEHLAAMQLELLRR
jgi:RNA polymerase sigma-70 factor (ECF subfamily)